MNVVEDVDHADMVVCLDLPSRGKSNGDKRNIKLPQRTVAHTAILELVSDLGPGSPTLRGISQGYRTILNGDKQVIY